jgi:hypothetical protein
MAINRIRRYMENRDWNDEPAGDRPVAPAGFIVVAAEQLPGVMGGANGLADLYRKAYEQALADVESTRSRFWDDRLAGPNDWN